VKMCRIIFSYTKVNKNQLVKKLGILPVFDRGHRNVSVLLFWSPNVMFF
jgi:hypothetical protein